MSLGEIMSLILFLVLLVLWVLPSIVKLPEGIASWLNMYWVAIAGSSRHLFFPPTVRKRKHFLTASDFKKLDWNMFLLVACGIGLTGLFEDNRFLRNSYPRSWPVSAAPVSSLWPHLAPPELPVSCQAWPQT